MWKIGCKVHPWPDDPSQPESFMNNRVITQEMMEVAKHAYRCAKPGHGIHAVVVAISSLIDKEDNAEMQDMVEVGEASSMPAANGGITMCSFLGVDVPVGTKLYIVKNG
jgi:hypothetical protein